MLAHPATGSFLAGGVQNHVDKVVVCFFVFDSENVAGDLNEVTIEVAFVPFFEHFVQLGVREAERMLHDVVGFADKLHVAVFDAVVNHLHVVTGSGFSHPVAAWDVVVLTNLRADLLEDVFDKRPCFRVTTRHDAWSLQRPLFAPGNAGADESKTFCH